MRCRSPMAAFRRASASFTRRSEICKYRPADAPCRPGDPTQSDHVFAFSRARGRSLLGWTMCTSAEPLVAGAVAAAASHTVGQSSGQRALRTVRTPLLETHSVPARDESLLPRIQGSCGTITNRRRQPSIVRFVRRSPILSAACTDIASNASGL